MSLSNKMKEATPGPSGDRLQTLKEAARSLRDGRLELSNLEEQVADKKKALYTLQHETLVELLTQSGVDRVGLEAEGNLPAYDAEMKPYYKASIAADWPEEKQAAAYNWLDGQGHGDLIKTIITIELPRGERETAKKVITALRELGVPFTEKMGVPWNTLTAWLKERIEVHKESPPLDLLGATAGKVVNLKERKSG